MPGLTPSSPPNASGTVRGLVSTVAQTFAGVKTFLARIVATLGITAGANRLDLRSDLGAGASDVCSVVGSTVADASVNAAAALLEGRTGLGSTEVTKFRVRKAGSFVAAVDNANAIAFGLSTDLVNVFPGVWYNPGVTELGFWNLGGSVFLGINLGTGGARASGSMTLGGNLLLPNATGGAIRQGINQAFYGSDFDASLNFRPGISASYDSISFKLQSGRIDRRGTDTTGTPGPAVVNDRASGKAAIAAGASSVVITCNQVTAASQVFITQHARDATCKELIAVPALGSFTVSGTANATAALPFSWEVSTLI